jgi:tetratricopeptide (TPR) repeat protein
MSLPRVLARSLCFCLYLFSLTAMAGVHDPQALAADPFTATSALAPRLQGLGQQHFKVTTTSADSQYYFDQGLRLSVGFNHSEALRAFKEAVRLDPNNAMAYWGWALVLGPNLNLPMQEAVVASAWDAMQRALALRSRVTEREADYIDALAIRYSEDPQADRSALDAAYAQAMARLSAKYPDDLNAATLYAAALMNTNPWDYWFRDGTPKPHTKILLAVLESVLERDPNHAAANHYYIHAVEAYRPNLGVTAADRLYPLMPGAGHLVHMPSHIYMRVGRYQDSWQVNVEAARADENYISQCNAQGIVPLAYYPHNIHFQVWSAMLLGNSARAMQAARKIEEKMPAQMKINPFGVNEAFRSQPMFAMVRFGLWQQVLAEPKPAGSAPFMQGIWHYGRGMAFNHSEQPDLARQELKQLRKLSAAVQAEPGYGVGFAAASTLMQIADNVLAGEIDASAGRFEAAISALDKAVRLQDSLLYNEPPDWYFPVRHIQGAVLLEAGRVAEAEVVYWEDLRRNPGNGYSLFGLHQSLLQQEDAETAREMQRRFEKAWASADVTLTSSRF